MTAPITITKPKVFIVNPVRGRDYALAGDFGELDSIIVSFIDFKNHPKVFATIAGAIANSSPNDFVLISGLTILNVVTVALWLSHHKTCRILNWVGNPGNSNVVTPPAVTNEPVAAVAQEGSYQIMTLNMDSLDILMNSLIPTSQQVDYVSSPQS